MSTIEFAIPNEIPMSCVTGFSLDLMDLPHVGAHRIPLNRDTADWDGHARAGDDDQHDRAYYTVMDRDPSYLDFAAIDTLTREDVEDECIEGAVRDECNSYMRFLADYASDTLQRALMHSVMMGDLTAHEADRFFVVIEPSLGIDHLYVLEPRTPEDMDYDDDRLYEFFDYMARQDAQEALANHGCEFE